MVKLPLAAGAGGVGADGLDGGGVGVRRVGVVRVDRGSASVCRGVALLLGVGLFHSSRMASRSSSSSQRERLRAGMAVELVLPISRYSGAMSSKKRLMTQNL